MKRLLLFLASFGSAIGVLMACGSSTVTPTLTLVPLFAVDGGAVADAGCSIGTTAIRVGCATAYEITGDPSACPGFDSTGTGSTPTCQALCNSGLACKLSGLSDGTNAVACTATCASPEH